MHVYGARRGAASLDARDMLRIRCAMFLYYATLQRVFTLIRLCHAAIEAMRGLLRRH